MSFTSVISLKTKTNQCLKSCFGAKKKKKKNSASELLTFKNIEMVFRIPNKVVKVLSSPTSI